ncbi:hypothetical protein VTI74DRAFT_8417 [Chaetomium olivicolor]
MTRHGCGKESVIGSSTGTRSISKLQESGAGGLVLATLRGDCVLEAAPVTPLLQHIPADYRASILHLNGGGGDGDT